MELIKYIKIVLALILVSLGILRSIYPKLLKSRIDTTLISLIILAFLVLVLPWDRLKSIKAAGVEVTLDQPTVQAAISGLGLERIEDEQLRKSLSRQGDDLEMCQGSRVLWIDDKSHNILGARRLLRALGIEVVSATSSEMAKEILDADNDFDLIVTDVQRIGQSYKEVENGIKIHEGANFIVVLRRNKDANIRSIPVIFYAAYDWERLVEFTRRARELLPEPGISNAIPDFIPKVVKLLADERQKPITFSKEKIPTSVNKIK